MLPVFAPSAQPSLKPTPVPTHLPTLRPSPEPTLEPTSADTATVAVSLALASDAATVTPDEEAELLSALASAMGLDPSSLRNFKVTVAPARRRRRLAGGSLKGTTAFTAPSVRQLAGYTWVAAFDVVVELSAVNAESPAAFASAIATSLTANAGAAVATTSVTATVDTASIATVAATRHPSPFPTKAPTAQDARSGKGSDSEGLSSAATAFVAVGVGVALVALGALAHRAATDGGAAKEVEVMETTEVEVEMPMHLSTLHALRGDGLPGPAGDGAGFEAARAELRAAEAVVRRTRALDEAKKAAKLDFRFGPDEDGDGSGGGGSGGGQPGDPLERATML